ncbi:MAG: amidase [Marinobacter sp.]|uniref:amidase n=1 Tax=Marinobacter sp. TaxID=50741 RepID=UPI00299D3461|nr:amidase [Marinobacter sp.]MDX1634390.1 amidase [Marinobacter sp.]
MTAIAPGIPVHSHTDDALGTDDATALAARLASGEVSLGEVIGAAIARARQVEPSLAAIACDDFARAATLQKLPARGLFAGVPTFIKDNTPVAGLPTGHGSAAVQPGPEKHNGPFTKQLLAQGLVCLGKSRLPEFGFNASTEPAHDRATANPWHPAYSAGASSGGSAALVAAGVVPIAHTNDGGGSTRIPAACCGLVGLKPSRGRLVDGEAARALPLNIIAEGVVTRNVRDTARFYLGAERSYRNPDLPAIGEITGPASRRLTIGLVTDSLNGLRTDAATRDSVEATARQLADLGHRIELMPVPVNRHFAEDFALYWAMLAFAVSTTGKRTIHRSFDRRRVDGLTRGLDRMFRRQFYRLPAALLRLRRSQRYYHQAIKGFDAVLTPVLGHGTPELGYLSPDLPFDTLFERLRRYVCFTPLANATGAPAISLPLGRDAAGLPLGIQLMARHGDEKTLLELAFELEAACPWPHPGIALSR